jgi:AcrR family transcriptional regulator
MPSQIATKRTTAATPAAATAPAAATRAAAAPSVAAVPATARAPKRQRGRLRVAAILQSAREVFMEKGYDAATMTEIAARSGTAIGSLYRFFPSKESLSDALLLHYLEQMTEGLAALTARTTDMTPEVAAASLVDLMLGLKDERSFVIALTEARGTNPALKTRYREAMKHGLTGVIRKVAPRLPRARSESMAVVLLHLLRAIYRTAAEEEPATQRAVLAEMRDLIRLYLVSAH